MKELIFSQRLPRRLLMACAADQGGTEMLMQTKLKLLTVNPAFLQEIKDSNQELWDTLHAVRQLCDSDQSRADVARGLVRLLNELRDHLSLQFALEESYGYLEGRFRWIAGSVIPQLARSQHCRLFLQLADLCELAEELQYRGFSLNEVAGLVEQVELFDQSLQQHERLENDLIEISFYDVR
ncbi:MAG: hypothetical protein R3C05_23375 [Pirellulaceae bacterium]